MAPTERRCESILLKERRSGAPRDVIKIRGSRLLVRNKFHGSSAGSDFSFSCHNSVSVENNNPALPIVVAPSHWRSDSLGLGQCGKEQPQWVTHVFSTETEL